MSALSSVDDEVKPQYRVRTHREVTGDGIAFREDHERPRLRYRDATSVSGSLSSPEREIDVRRLYEATGKDDLSVALRLLDNAVLRINNAASHLAGGDVLMADDEVSAVSPLVSKLFCFRSIGEGFDNIVSAVMEALANGKGQPPQREQISEVARVLRRLRDEPFLTFESSLDMIEALRATGLQDTPSEIVGLANAIAESCPR